MWTDGWTDINYEAKFLFFYLFFIFYLFFFYFWGGQFDNFAKVPKNAFNRRHPVVIINA